MRHEVAAHRLADRDVGLQQVVQRLLHLLRRKRLAARPRRVHDVRPLAVGQLHQLLLRARASRVRDGAAIERAQSPARHEGRAIWRREEHSLAARP